MINVSKLNNHIHSNQHNLASYKHASCRYFDSRNLLESRFSWSKDSSSGVSLIQTGEPVPPSLLEELLELREKDSFSGAGESTMRNDTWVVDS
jgi:hypothetical protein